MTLTVKPMSYTVTVVGASFSYGVYQVTDSTGVQSPAAFPGHFVLNAGAALVNPATDDTQQLVLAALQNLTTAFEALTTALSGAVVLTGAFGQPLAAS